MGKEKMYYEEMGYDFDPPFYTPTSKPIVTNYDRIISKTPEELASLFSDYRQEHWCPPDAMDCVEYCTDCWREWLKQEATK